LNAGDATSLEISNAAALNLGAATLTSLESLNASGAGDLTIGTLAALNSGTITNTGEVMLGVIGDPGLGYGITLSSTGAELFSATSLTTNDEAISLTVADAVGDVTVGAIDADQGSTANSGNVDVTISSGEDVDLSTLNGDDVTVDVTAVGTADVGATVLLR
jgi:hypothetical protein